MKIELTQVAFGDIAKNYKDNGEAGVTAFDGKLEVRPSYQREFVYKDKKRDAVVESVIKGLPLNVMYWQKNADGTYSVMDGQQRTISVCQYINGDYSINDRYFHNLTEDEKQVIKDYKCLIYVCDGTESEILTWFKTINISTEPLTEQELRNSAYTGKWLYEAKKYFSKTSCPAYQTASNLLNGTAIRQDYLETVIDWIVDAQKLQSIEDYMAIHQHDEDASELWLYFGNVVNWVRAIFPNYRKEMKGIKWGILYNEYHNNHYNPNALEEQIVRLMEDEDVTNKKGIYEYVLSGKEKYLSIRQFSERDKRTAYEQQKGICPMCGEHYEFKDMHGDHKTSWVCGGRTVFDNLQMLCGSCNLKKSSVSLRGKLEI